MSTLIKSNRNEISMENNPKKEKEVVNSSENQQNNEDLKKSTCKGILLEMNYRNEQLPDDSNKIEQIAIEYCIKLLEWWIEQKAIEGVRIHEGKSKSDRFEYFDNWLYPIQVIKRESTMIIHIIIQVNISMSTYKLYQEGQEIY